MLIVSFGLMNSTKAKFSSLDQIIVWIYKSPSLKSFQSGAVLRSGCNKMSPWRCPSGSYISMTTFLSVSVLPRKQDLESFEQGSEMVLRCKDISKRGLWNKISGENSELRSWWKRTRQRHVVPSRKSLLLWRD